MGRTIYKYNLSDACRLNSGAVEMPEHAFFLSVQMQHGNVTLWAMVDPDAKMATRRFRIFGTGHEITGFPSVNHIGTVQEEGGRFVWHVFEMFAEPRHD